MDGELVQLFQVVENDDTWVDELQWYVFTLLFTLPPCSDILASPPLVIFINVAYGLWYSLWTFFFLVNNLFGLFILAAFIHYHCVLNPLESGFFSTSTVKLLLSALPVISTQIPGLFSSYQQPWTELIPSYLKQFLLYLQHVTFSCFFTGHLSHIFDRFSFLWF